MSTVKYGDTHAITFTVLDPDGAPVDLTGATVRVLAVSARGVGNDTIELASSISVAVEGTVVHQLTGTLPVGPYNVEVEVTQGSVVTTAPSAGYATLKVVADIEVAV
jgi:hypothetical protein